MALSLAEELAATKSEVDEISSGLEKRIRKVQDDAAQAIVDLVEAAADRKARLLIRLSHLEAAVSGDDGGSGAPGSEAATSEPKSAARPKLSAAEVILTALAEKELTANEVDQAVIGYGLSKAAAEKAKGTCNKSGWATHHKRVWTITPEGLRKIRGQDPPPET